MGKFEECFCKPDLKLAAVCGHFCTSCTLFIGVQEDPERLKVLAERLHRSIDELTCYGCRSEKKSFYCNTVCKMKKCADDRGVSFCSECTDYPCAEFKAFEAEAQDRIEVGKDLGRIKEVGYEQWYQEMVEHYSCPKCHTINSAHDMVCRKCGAEPSCNYVKLNKQEIIQRQLALRQKQQGQ